jgi:hypothetical protein
MKTKNTKITRIKNKLHSNTPTQQPRTKDEYQDQAQITQNKTTHGTTSTILKHKKYHTKKKNTEHANNNTRTKDKQQTQNQRASTKPNDKEQRQRNNNQ